MTARVSVVMPAFNAAHTLNKALASVAAQTYRDLEIILVDDASSDDTAERARQILTQAGLQHRVIRLEANVGPAEARNIGVRQARGEYIAFLDSDDYWLPEKIERQVELMDANPQVHLCGCQAEWVNGTGAVIGPLYEKLPTLLQDGWKTLMWNSYVATPCAMVRRHDLGSRPFNRELKVGEDRDLWIRLASNGDVALVPEVMVRITSSPATYMPRNAAMILSCTQPMIEGHVRAFSDMLSLNDRRRIRGKLYSNVGKGLCVNPDQFRRGSPFLLMAALLLYQPFDNLRFLIYSAPGFRQMKEKFKKFMDGERLIS